MPLFPPSWTLVSSSKDTTHSYSWVGKGGKLAIAEMSFDTLGMPKIFKWTELPGIGVGMEENVLAYSINPNPFVDFINVEGDFCSSLKIIDALGNVLLVPSTLNQGNRMFDTRGLPSGMYFLRYQYQNVDRVEKLIKH